MHKLHYAARFMPVYGFDCYKTHVLALALISIFFVSTYNVFDCGGKEKKMSDLDLVCEKFGNEKYQCVVFELSFLKILNSIFSWDSSNLFNVHVG